MMRFLSRKKLWVSMGLLVPLFFPKAMRGTERFMRKMAVAGSFYPGEPAVLSTAVDELLKEANPLTLSGELKGILVPHAGYVYSGGVAAYGFKAAGTGWDTVVLMGPSHRVPIRGASLWAKGSFETPLGDVPIDEAMASELLKSCPLIESSTEPHVEEHSLEVELPFIQKSFGPVKIVPLLLNNEHDMKGLSEIGRAVGRAMKGKKALLVVSSDLSHYPASDLARRIDQTTIASFLRLDPDFVQLTSEILLERGEPNVACTACGEAALISALSTFHELGVNEAELLRYTNSGELDSGADKRRSVGYSAVAFMKSGKPKGTNKLLSDEAKHILLATARTSIKEELSGKSYHPQALSSMPELNFPAAVFVTLMKRQGLRGCVGTLEPHSTLLEAVRTYARAAAFDDSRFPRVKENEVNDLHIEISILSPMTRIPTHESIIPGKHGVVVERGSRKGLFLPTVWEQLPGKAEFLSELCSQKAGLPRDCWKDPKTTLSVFTTDVFEEK